MCVCVCVCMYVCVCIYMCVCVCVRKGDNVYIDITFIIVRKRKQLSKHSQALPAHPSGKANQETY